MKRALGDAVLAFTIIGLFCTMSEAAKNEVEFVEPTLNPSEIDRIVVLPAADLRKDNETKLKKLHLLQTLANNVLNGRKYDAIKLEDGKPTTDVTMDELETVDPGWVQGLGPDDARWIFLMTLEDLAARKHVGLGYGVVCVGYLFDKQNGKLMWRNEEAAKTTGGWLVGKAARSDSLRKCALQVTKPFPAKPKSN